MFILIDFMSVFIFIHMETWCLNGKIKIYDVPIKSDYIDVKNRIDNNILENLLI